MVLSLAPINFASPVPPQENARLSVHNYHRGLRVADALGLPSKMPLAAASLATLMSQSAPAPLKALLPASEYASALGSYLLAFGRSELINGIGHGATHFLGHHRKAQAAKLVAAAKALPLIFPRHELGMTYTGPGAAIISDAHAPSAATAIIELPPLSPAESHGASTRVYSQPRENSWEHVPASSAMENETYVLKSAPGFRLAHHWLVMTPGSASDVAGKDLGTEDGGSCGVSGTRCGMISTLDLVSSALPEPSASNCSPMLTLIVDAAGDRCWARGAQRLPAAWPLQVVRVATQTSAPVMPAIGCKARIVRTLIDPDGGWVTKRQVEPSGALLVRADGHMAWRAVSATVADVATDAEAAARLVDVLENLLHPDRLLH